MRRDTDGETPEDPSVQEGSNARRSAPPDPPRTRPERAAGAMTHHGERHQLPSGTGSQGWRLRVVLLYAVGASLWILLSDRALEWLVQDPAQVALTNTLKGWAFVALTSLLLHALLHRFTPGARSGGPPAPGRWGLMFVLLTMWLGAGAIGFDIARKLASGEGWEIARSGAGPGPSAWLVLLAVLTLLATSAGFVIWRQRQALEVARGVQRAQAERLRTNELLAAIADSSDDAIFAKDLEGRYTLFNRAASRFVGQPAEAVLGQDDRAIFPVDQAEQLIAIGRAVIANRHAQTQEEELDTPEGTRVFLATKAPLHDAQGRIIGLYGISRDITRDKLAEEALRLSERRFQDIVAASADWIWELDARGRFTYASESLHELLGYAPEEILGKTPFDLMPPEEAKRIGARLLALDARHVAFRDLQHISLHRDGSQRHVSTSGMPIRDGADRLLGYRGLDRDITERAQAEAELRASEALFRSLFDKAPVSILVHDRESGEVIDANRQAIAAYGYASLEELRSCDFMDEPPYGFEDAVRLIRQAAAGGQQHFEWKNRDRFGTIFWEEVWLNRLVLNGIERVMAIGVDITERKAAEEGQRHQAEELTRRFAELKRFNRATVDRELAMIELKRRINALSLELGREAPYPLSFLNDPDGA